MTHLYIISRPHVVEDTIRHALRTWRTDRIPTIVSLSEANRLGSLLSLIGNEQIDLNRVCFAVDAGDRNGWTDFNVFLAALRMYEKTSTSSPVVIRSLNCNV